VAKIRSSDITDRRIYLNRRSFMQGLAAAGGAMLVADTVSAGQPAAHGRKLMTVRSALSTTEKPNSWEQVTSYNNFYEFGTSKSDPAASAPRYRPPQPWTVSIEGECAKPGRMNLEDILKGQTLEDRIYRHRCVEGWSMIIPWVGFPLANLVKKAEPSSPSKASARNPDG
jgi:sulfoxide reductase catalytic subunit YedY